MNKRNVKAELLEALKGWKADDPKILCLWTEDGVFSSRRLRLHADEVLILTDGLAYSHDELFDITLGKPVEVEIRKVRDFSLKYEQAGRLCEDELSSWYRFEEVMREKENRELNKKKKKLA